MSRVIWLVIATALCDISAAQNINVVSSLNYAYTENGEVYSPDQLSYLSASADWDAVEATATDGAVATSADGGRIEVSLDTSASISSSVSAPMVTLLASSEFRLDVVGAISGGAFSFGGGAQSYATLQVNAANPMDDVELEITVHGGADAYFASMTQGFFGFTYEDDEFDAVVSRGSIDYIWEDVENTMDFFFDGSGTLDTTMTAAFYVELPSGSQIDVSCYSSFYGSATGVGAPELGVGFDEAFSYGQVDVEILP